MALAIFDLDHTLLDGDTDHLWNSFLCDQGAMDRTEFEARYHQFNASYDAGSLQPDAYCRALVDALDHIPTARLMQLLEVFTREVIPAHITPQALELLDTHRARGDFLLVITATVDFLAQCPLQALPVDDFIASKLHWLDGRPTGQMASVASFREGKIVRLQEWLQGRSQTMAGSWFYSDSINDLPLLQAVDNPVAVNADAPLQKIATEKCWPQLRLRR